MHWVHMNKGQLFVLLYKLGVRIALPDGTTMYSTNYEECYTVAGGTLITVNTRPGTAVS